MTSRLKRILPKHSGRDAAGHVSVRHQGGRHKRFLREIDFKRAKHGVPARVEAIEYDPNRTADIALLVYLDGDRRYILAPQGLKVGDQIMSGKKAEVEIGNALALRRIPVGMPIHNIELHPGKGGQMARGAGTSALIQSKEDGMAVLKLPSGEVRQVPWGCLATIGQLGNID